MKKLMFAIVLFLLVPTLRAQQAETSGSSPQTASQPEPQPLTQTPNAQEDLPASLRPGHPLDPADVDILTGKRDREIAAAQRAAVPISVGMYGNYGDPYLMQGRLAGRLIFQCFRWRESAIRFSLHCNPTDLDAAEFAVAVRQKSCRTATLGCPLTGSGTNRTGKSACATQTSSQSTFSAGCEATAHKDDA
jgi:hypothetical protein